MALTSDYNQAKTLKQLQLAQEVEYMKMVEKMKFIAGKFLTKAREQPQGHQLGFYNDKTKKLRRSIAVYIFRNKRIIWANEDGNTAENRRLILEKYSPRHGFSIVAIAGKDYATTVESLGYNVISAQAHTFIAEIDLTFLTMKTKI